MHSLMLSYLYIVIPIQKDEFGLLKSLYVLTICILQVTTQYTCIHAHAHRRVHTHIHTHARTHT